MLDSKRGATFLISTFIVLIIVLTFPALKLVKFRMLPKADVNQFFVYVDLFVHSGYPTAWSSYHNI